MPHEDTQNQPPQDVPQTPDRFEGVTAYDPTVDRALRDQPPPLTNDDGEVLPSFDRRYAQDLEGLLFVGSLSETFSWLGHTFVIRTLTQGELLLVPILVKEWTGTIGEVKAYAAALVSLAVVSVDGKHLPLPVEASASPHDWASQRFTYVRNNWFHYTIDAVYEKYVALEDSAREVVDAMVKASGPAGSTGGLKPAAAGPSDKAF